jgi:Zn-dependent peptidase ImmA (M78 family)
MAQTTAPYREATKLLQEAGITKAPVNVEALAAKVGAVISYEVFKEDLSGVLVKEKARTVIGVNSFHAKTRQRFTIAHEIGHLVLKHKGDVFVDQTVMRRDARSAQAVDPQEIMANQFAAELLMPKDLVIEAVLRRQAKKPDLSSVSLVDELADEFQVSPQAMEYRLTNLGMFMPR